jgi:hypothetical protein
MHHLSDGVPVTHPCCAHCYTCTPDAMQAPDHMLPTVPRTVVNLGEPLCSTPASQRGLLSMTKAAYTVVVPLTTLAFASTPTSTQPCTRCCWMVAHIPWYLMFRQHLASLLLCVYLPAGTADTLSEVEGLLTPFSTPRKVGEGVAACWQGKMLTSGGMGAQGIGLCPPLWGVS